MLLLFSHSSHLLIPTPYLTFQLSPLITEAKKHFGLPLSCAFPSLGSRLVMNSCLKKIIGKWRIGLVARVLSSMGLSSSHAHLYLSSSMAQVYTWLWSSCSSQSNISSLSSPLISPSCDDGTQAWSPSHTLSSLFQEILHFSHRFGPQSHWSSLTPNWYSYDSFPFSSLAHHYSSFLLLCAQSCNPGLPWQAWAFFFFCWLEPVSSKDSRQPCDTRPYCAQYSSSCTWKSCCKTHFCSTSKVALFLARVVEPLDLAWLDSCSTSDPRYLCSLNWLQLYLAEAVYVSVLTATTSSSRWTLSSPSSHPTATSSRSHCPWRPPAASIAPASAWNAAGIGRIRPLSYISVTRRLCFVDSKSTSVPRASEESLNSGNCQVRGRPASREPPKNSAQSRYCQGTVSLQRRRRETSWDWVPCRPLYPSGVPL